MHQHLLRDRPDDRCWADLPDNPAGKQVCDRANIVRPIGLCPNHRFELTGRGIFDPDDVDDVIALDPPVDLLAYAVEVARLGLEAA